MIVADLAVSLILVQVGNGGIFKLLREFLLLPHCLKQLEELRYKGGTTSCKNLRRYSIRALFLYKWVMEASLNS